MTRRCRLCKSTHLHPPWGDPLKDPWRCLDCGASSYFPLSVVEGEVGSTNEATRVHSSGESGASPVRERPGPAWPDAKRRHTAPEKRNVASGASSSRSMAVVEELSAKDES